MQKTLLSALCALLFVWPVMASAADLDQRFETLIGDAALRGADVGLHVVDVETGQTVFSHRGEEGFHPASTMKVLTSAAALHHLGPSYRFSTTTFTDERIDAAGVVKGNLYVQGHADPTLVIEKLWKLVYDMELAGLEEVRGDVVFDEAFLSTSYALPGWNKKEDLDEGPSYFPSLSALSVNFNTVAVVVAPGSEVNKPARVQLETAANGYVTIDNQVTTASPGTRRWIDIDRVMEDGQVKITVKGSMPSNADMRRYYRAVPDPTAHFMAVFKGLMEDRGIKVSGAYRRGPVPGGARELVDLPSPPLPAVLMDMNKYSNNYMAELVLRTLGAEVSGVPGTTEKGLDAVVSYLQHAGVDVGDLQLVNGSGLTRKASIAPVHLTAVLEQMHSDRRVGAEFHTSLAIGGLDGTLVRRLTDQPGRVRGKTGTIDGVHCLTGFVSGADERTYAFAFMVNDIKGSISRVRKVHDQFARALMDNRAAASDSPQVVPGG
jgi:serine-type D-Ala-D-Ala carboxypeptidase/endopeptidase (penicillin-binding protein 4)